MTGFDRATVRRVVRSQAWVFALVLWCTASAFVVAMSVTQAKESEVTYGEALREEWRRGAGSLELVCSEDAADVTPQSFTVAGGI